MLDGQHPSVKDCAHQSLPGCTLLSLPCRLHLAPTLWSSLTSSACCSRQWLSLLERRQGKDTSNCSWTAAAAGAPQSTHHGPMACLMPQSRKTHDVLRLWVLNIEAAPRIPLQDCARIRVAAEPTLCQGASNCNVALTAQFWNGNRWSCSIIQKELLVKTCRNRCHRMQYARCTSVSGLATN